MTAAHVTLRQAESDHRNLLENLLELYCHDLSPYFPIKIGPDGRFGYASLPRYWEEPDLRFPYLIEADGAIAGFALATRGSPATEDQTHLDVAEFFVLRALRQRGIGERAATLLWDELPGHWTVRVATVNRPALAFWEGAIERYAGDASRRWTLQQGGVERIVLEVDSRTRRA